MNSAIHNKKVFVARNCGRTSGITSSNVATKLAYGEMVVLSKKGSIIGTAAEANAAEAIRLMIGTRDGSPIISDLIYKKSLKQVLSSKFKFKREKKVAIGYNGSAGSIDVIAANPYALEVEVVYDGKFAANRYMTRVSYESKLTGDTQFNIANNLALLLSLEMNQYNKGLRIGIISDDAGAAGATGCEVTHKSRSVSYTAGTPPTVGQAVVIAGVTGSFHRDEDNTVYLVTYVDTANNYFELDREYSNRSQTGIAINTIADTSTGNYGITIEAESLEANDVRVGSIMTNFEAIAFNFGDTTKTDNGTFAIDTGFGSFEDVRNKEYVYGDGEGRNIYKGDQFQHVNSNTDVGTGYSLVTLVFDTLSSPNLLDTHSVPKEVDVYLQRGVYQDILDDAAGTEFGTNIKVGTGLSGVDGDGVLNVLNAFAVNAGVLAATANTVANGGKEMTSGTIFSSGIDV